MLEDPREGLRRDADEDFAVVSVVTIQRVLILLLHASSRLPLDRKPKHG